MSVQPSGAENSTPVRKPNSAEKRCIVRHAHKFYNNVVIAGVYDVSSSKLDADGLRQPNTYFPALAACVKQHPFLSTVLQHVGTKQETFARVHKVNLKQHIDIRHGEDIFGVDVATTASSMNEATLFGRVFEYVHKEPTLTYFGALDKAPAWQIVVLPLDFYDGADKGRVRVLVCFSFSHSHGDGMSGLAFHQTFMRAFADSLERDTTHQIDAMIETNPATLPSLPHLAVTPMYLLTPALGHYLPSFLKNFLGIRASVSGVDEFTWTGTKTFHTPTESGAAIDTAVEILSIKPDVVAAVLRKGRSHGTRLTALIAEILARCMNHHLPRYASLSPSTKTAVCAISTNIRKAFDISDDHIGVFGSATYITHRLDPNPNPTHASDHTPIEINPSFWQTTQIETTNLAQSSKMKKNQPIGLLNWISNFDTWVQDQLNDRRDGSWEISNLGCFKVDKPTSTPASTATATATATATSTTTQIQTRIQTQAHTSESTDSVKLEDIFFTQPANVIGFPLVFDLVSLEHGALNICAGWQIGALGLKHDSNETGVTSDGENVRGRGQAQVQVERQFVRSVLRDIDEHLAVVCREE